jgi:hypothetical protein
MMKIEQRFPGTGQAPVARRPSVSKYNIRTIPVLKILPAEEGFFRIGKVQLTICHDKASLCREVTNRQLNLPDEEKSRRAGAV